MLPRSSPRAVQHSAKYYGKSINIRYGDQPYRSTPKSKAKSVALHCRVCSKQANRLLLAYSTHVTFVLLASPLLLNKHGIAPGCNAVCCCVFGELVCHPVELSGVHRHHSLQYATIRQQGILASQEAPDISREYLRRYPVNFL